ncbi:hypothetical protein JAAARDRAFT_203950 [Jaapia argillacea MUCL 33604]|uniref:Linoleate diol synthase n=1 Tax=Jaapia argillacea MUCL 33604 TaxID=933084 RepID=A0A067QFT2_9AGAM|nr:hypothetical protein JAAARDRAFT_203950 [Jaapia argillacea MUCL 33604]
MSSTPIARKLDDHPEDHGVQKIIRDFREQIRKGFPVPLDLSSLSSVVDAIRHSDAIDDRKMLLEHVLMLMSRLPPGSILTKLQNATVELLYNDLPHPPASYIGPEYAYRTADGSNNNIEAPDMGKAGTPYSRSVQQQKALPSHVLPDPGLVFDVLLKREGFVKHPAGLSSLFFSFAALVIHTVFRTSHANVNINETSSYVDLAPLYGNNQESQNKVRVRDGRGLMHPDVFAEDRLLLLPPAVCVLLVLFNRNHNYIAKKLLEINERGTYIDPATIPLDDPERNSKLLDQEEDIFQTARLINVAWFGGVVFSDYFSCILGLVRQGSSWSLNPFGEIRNEDRTLFERGRGNACSVEFNCLYRWHATTSAEDEKWVELVFKKLFPTKTYDQVSPMDFKATAKAMEAMEPDCTHWTFGNLQRQADGTFKSEDLANFLFNATEHPAAAFRGRGTPPVMRLNEIMGIEQSRKWGCCSLNDFRSFLGLKRYASFREWNPNPEIADAAEKLYGQIDNLELYVGLQAEEAKPLIDGAGLCPGYTISRAILSDAIALTRGDRFFTADFTPFNLTAWGFADCQRDTSGPGFGSMLGRLFLRALPDNCEAESTYTWFPLMTPDSMKGYLQKLEVAGQYSFSRPTGETPLRVVEDYKEIQTVLKSPDGYKVASASLADSLVDGAGFYLASSDPVRSAREQRDVLRALGDTAQATDRIAQFFYQKTKELITTRSYALVGGKTKCIDIVGDVLKAVPLQWVASEISGFELKKAKDGPGLYTEAQLYDILGNIYGHLFLDSDPSKAISQKIQVKSQVKELVNHIKENLPASVSGRLSLVGLLDQFSQLFKTYPKSAREQFAEGLSELGLSADKIANSILAVMVGATIELSQSLVHVINAYLGDEKTPVSTPSGFGAASTASSAIKGYVFEALRLDPPFAGVYREVAGPSVSAAKTQRLFLDIAKAGNEAGLAAQGDGPASYLLGDGCARFLGVELTSKILTSVLRAISEFNNVRRAPGISGQLKRFPANANRAVRWEYLNDSQQASPWPTAMLVQFDLA